MVGNKFSGRSTKVVKSKKPRKNSFQFRRRTKSYLALAASLLHVSDSEEDEEEIRRVHDVDDESAMSGFESLLSQVEAGDRDDQQGHRHLRLESRNQHVREEPRPREESPSPDPPYSLQYEPTDAEVPPEEFVQQHQEEETDHRCRLEVQDPEEDAPLSGGAGNEEHEPSASEDSEREVAEIDFQEWGTYDIDEEARSDNNDFICPECFETFANEHELRCHELQEHRDEDAGVEHARVEEEQGEDPNVQAVVNFQREFYIAGLKGQASWSVLTSLMKVVQNYRSALGSDHKISTFPRIRQKMLSEQPRVKIDLVYEDAQREVKVMKGLSSFPRKKFQEENLKCLAEISYYSIKSVLAMAKKMHPTAHEGPPNCRIDYGVICLSIDGIAETATVGPSRSLTVICLRFRNCHQIYPVKIHRPFGKRVLMKATVDELFSEVFAELQAERIKIDFFTADAPMRALLR
jgi:hypothetical protein